MSGNAAKKEYVQYSKRLTTFVMVAWVIFRVLSLVVIALRPEADSALVALQKGADDVTIVAIGFYCGNSVAEKGIVNYFHARHFHENEEEEECSEESLG